MISDQGTILRLYPLRETSVIAVWLTATHGILRTVAKSATRAGGAFLGHLDLFFHNDLQWKTARQGDLHHLTSTTVINTRGGLRLDYGRLSLASYFSKLILQTVEPATPASDYFDLMQRALAHLEQAAASRRALLHFERELARLHGIGQGDSPAWVMLNKQFGSLPRMRASLWDRLPER